MIGRGLHKVVELLGGDALYDSPFSTALEAHALIERGFPNGSAISLVDQVPAIGRGETLTKVVGISLRALHRRKTRGSPERLNREQSARLYKLADVVAKAIDVCGSIQDAERFLIEPAMGLNRLRPIDLLTTPAGAGLVERHLARMDLGVYA